jgi:hypothetical protein
MQGATLLIFLTGVYPVWLAWQANRRTSLSLAVHWMVVAWVAWGALLVYRGAGGVGSGFDLPAYLTLCLTGCASVAVLGARRPGVIAWNFVVVALLAVMLLPVAENLFTPGLPLGFFRSLFLGATLAVGILNYLPTRLAPAALALALGCASEFVVLTTPVSSAIPAWNDALGGPALALAPWLGLLAWRLRPRPRAKFDQQWLEFRDRFGLVWGQRVREQFNRSAANAGWPVHLYWRGLRLSPGAAFLGGGAPMAIVAALRALLKRFGEEGDGPDAEETAGSQRPLA